MNVCDKFQLYSFSILTVIIQRNAFRKRSLSAKILGILLLRIILLIPRFLRNNGYVKEYSIFSGLPLAAVKTQSHRQNIQLFGLIKYEYKLRSTSLYILKSSKLITSEKTSFVFQNDQILPPMELWLKVSGLVARGGSQQSVKWGGPTPRSYPLTHFAAYLLKPEIFLNFFTALKCTCQLQTEITDFATL